MLPALREDAMTPEDIAAGQAELRVEIRHLTAAVVRLTDRLDTTESRVNVLDRLTERGRGVWTTVMGVCTVLVTLGGSVAWAVETFGKGVMR